MLRFIVNCSKVAFLLVSTTADELSYGEAMRGTEKLRWKNAMFKDIVGFLCLGTLSSFLGSPHQNGS